MRIEIEEVEIKAAIIAHYITLGWPITAAQTDVDLKAGRGEYGMTATLSITALDNTAPVITDDTVVPKSAPVLSLETEDVFPKEDSKEPSDTTKLFNHNK